MIRTSGFGLKDPPHLAWSNDPVSENELKIYKKERTNLQFKIISIDFNDEKFEEFQYNRCLKITHAERKQKHLKNFDRKVKK